MTTAKSISEFKKLFEKLSYSQDYSTTFNAFLDYALWRLTLLNPQDIIQEEVKRLNILFDEKYVPVISEMFDALTWATDNEGTGFYDVLGDLFMELISHGRNGQYFTPQPICDMMAQLTYGQDLQEGKKVCDPACGSGRMLMSVAKLQRHMSFYGSDNDLTCVKMCVINMMLNSMPGEIAWMNALSMEHYKSYFISLHRFGNYFLPMLTIRGKDETTMKHHFHKQATITEPVHEKIKIQKFQLELF